VQSSLPQMAGSWREQINCRDGYKIKGAHGSEMGTLGEDLGRKVGKGPSAVQPGCLEKWKGWEEHVF